MMENTNINGKKAHNVTDGMMIFANKYVTDKIKDTFANSKDIRGDFAEFCELSKEENKAKRVKAKERIDQLKLIKEALEERITYDSTIGEALVLKDTICSVDNEIIRLLTKYYAGVITSQKKRITKLESQVPKELLLDDMIRINYHGFSANYMYKPLDKGRMCRSRAYNRWIENFPYNELPDVDEMWQRVDFTKDISVKLGFVCKDGQDVNNYIKSMIDLLANRYGFDDVIATEIVTKKLGSCDSYNDGEIYINIENRERDIDE